MPKRAAPLSFEAQVVRHEDSFGYYRAQVAKLLSQEESISRCVRQSNTAIGAGMSNLKKEDLNVLLRECVRDLTPEIDEMQRSVSSIYLISQLGKRCPSSSPSLLQSIPEEHREAAEEDIQLLLSSDPDLVNRISSKYSNVLLSQLENMQQQLENLLDDVVTTCRPMTRGEKRDLQRSIKELPKRNLDRIAEIVGSHCIASGKEFSDEVIVKLDESDNIMLWRLHFYVGAVKSAQKLAG